MEPGPETQRAFERFEIMIIAKAPVWVPALIALFGALWLLREAPAFIKIGAVGLLLWLFADHVHRRAFARVASDLAGMAWRALTNWTRERMRAAPERQRVMGIASVPADRFGWLRNVPWIRVIAIGAVFMVVFFFLKPVVGFFSCPFGWCETKEEVVADRDALRGAIKVDAVLDDERRDVAEIGKGVAVQRERVRVQSERGRDEIAAAAPEVEAPLNPELVAAWRVALNRLCLYPEASGALPAGC